MSSGTVIVAMRPETAARGGFQARLFVPEVVEERGTS